MLSNTCTMYKRAAHVALWQPLRYHRLLSRWWTIIKNDTEERRNEVGLIPKIWLIGRYIENVFEMCWWRRCAKVSESHTLEGSH